MGGGRVVPTHRTSWPQIGIARAQPMDYPRFCAHLGHSRALQAPPHTRGSPHSTYPPQDQYRRDSNEYILKVVTIPECRRKGVMRPGILPYSKTGSKVTTLNFQYFLYRSPSLTRNKWSRFRPGSVFIVKTAKCRQMGATRVDGRTGTGSIPPRTDTVGTLLIDPLQVSVLASSIQAPGSRLQAPGSSNQAPAIRLQQSGSSIQYPVSSIHARTQYPCQNPVSMPEPSHASPVTASQPARAPRRGVRRSGR